MEAPILQIALDLLNAERALSIATQAVKGDKSCWIEAGTPLIKSEGMEIIRNLRDLFPKRTIVADMKVMDTGSLEIEMASKAGSDVITILAASDDSTIKEALKSARKYGTKLMVDLIGVKEKILRAQQLGALDVDYLCIHVGIDEQMRGKKPIDVLKSIVQNTAVPVAVAGGLNSETVSEVVQAGAHIIIVGGAITKAKDVTHSVHLIKQAMMTQTPIETTLFKKYDSTHLRKAFSLVSTPNISDAMHKMGAMKEIRPIRLGFHMVGRALTVKTIDGDWAKPIDAIDRGKKDTVITVDVNGGRTAVWGELATWSAKKKGIRGVVIDGAVRDLDDLLKINFPIFCRYISSNAGEPKGFGEIGAEIICGGQTVQNGDWIIGDDSGVVVVPQQNAQEIANRALDVKEQENRIREEIKSGGSLGKVLKVKKWEKKIG